ncbi:MAG: hypothetical protein AAGF33_16820 [Pseudomonadota bacterium]
MICDEPSRDEARVYIVWHPDFLDGEGIAKQLIADLDRATAGGDMLSVPTEVRSAPVPGFGQPILIDRYAAQFSVAVLLSERHLVRAMQSEWRSFRDALADSVPDISGRTTRHFVLPLIFALDDMGALDPMQPDQDAPNGTLWDAPQAIRAYSWDEDPAHQAVKRVLFVLRTLLIGLELTSDTAEMAADRHLVFLSHAKADKIAAQERGTEVLIEALRSRMADTGVALDPFFDETHLTPALGWRFQFLRAIERSSFVALRTDAYGSRPVCQWELLEAKRRRRPAICIDAVSERELVSFAYGGNLPTLRLGAELDLAGIDTLLMALIGETVRCMIWLREAARVVAKIEFEAVTLLPRPAELADLAFHVMEHKDQPSHLIYPDPPLSNDALALIDALRPDWVQILPLSAVREDRS